MAESSYPAASSGSVTETRTNRESIKVNFDKVKRFAATNFTRARQFVTEKAGKAEAVTEYDSEFESLCQQLDQIKLATEHMLTHVESIVQPNPNARFEDWTMTKLNRPKPVRSNTHFLFSAELARASQSFGEASQYGAFLERCSQIETKLGESEKRFQEKATSTFITPLKAFLEIDVKNVLRDKRLLGVKRLDMDAQKNRVKRSQGEALQVAETELRAAQADYDAQLEKVRKSLKKIVETHVNHMGYLKTFMVTQREFFAECQALLGDLEGGPVRSPGVGVASSHSDSSVGGTFEVAGIELDKEDSRKAKMLYDYDAENEGELTISAGEVITVTPLPDDDEYMMAEFKGKLGKVPSTYVELL